MVIYCVAPRPRCHGQQSLCLRFVCGRDENKSLQRRAFAVRAVAWVCAAQSSQKLSCLALSAVAFDRIGRNPSNALTSASTRRRWRRILHVFPSRRRSPIYIFIDLSPYLVPCSPDICAPANIRPAPLPKSSSRTCVLGQKVEVHVVKGGSVAEWLACWTQAQKGPGSNRSRDAVG